MDVPRGVRGSGSILRDCNGKVLWAQAAFFGEVTNMIAETKALLQGVECCKQQGISKLVTEVDSLKYFRKWRIVLGRLAMILEE